MASISLSFWWGLQLISFFLASIYLSFFFFFLASISLIFFTSASLIYFLDSTTLIRFSPSKSLLFLSFNESSLSLIFFCFFGFGEFHFILLLRASFWSRLLQVSFFGGKGLRRVSFIKRRRGSCMSLIYLFIYLFFLFLQVSLFFVYVCFGETYFHSGWGLPRDFSF